MAERATAARDRAQKPGLMSMAVQDANGVLIFVRLTVSIRLTDPYYAGDGTHLVVIVDWDVCTGCTICAKECPWDTITMIPGTRLKNSLAKKSDGEDPNAVYAPIHVIPGLLLAPVVHMTSTLRHNVLWFCQSAHPCPSKVLASDRTVAR